MNQWLNAFIEAGGDTHIVTIPTSAKNAKIANTPEISAQNAYSGNYGKFGIHTEHTNNKDKTLYPVALPIAGNGKNNDYCALVADAKIAKNAKTHEWDETDWQDYYNERAGIYEYDGGLSRLDAERQAFDACIAHWMNLNSPDHNNPDECPQCYSAVIMAANNAAPVMKKGGHIWLHDNCWSGWMERRKQQAIKALTIMGIMERN